MEKRKPSPNSQQTKHPRPLGAFPLPGLQPRGAEREALNQVFFSRTRALRWKGRGACTLYGCSSIMSLNKAGAREVLICAEIGELTPEVEREPGPGHGKLRKLGPQSPAAGKGKPSSPVMPRVGGAQPSRKRKPLCLHAALDHVRRCCIFLKKEKKKKISVLGAGKRLVQNTKEVSKPGNHLVAITALRPRCPSAASSPRTRRRPHVRAQPHSGAHVPVTRVCTRTHGRHTTCQLLTISPCRTHCHTYSHTYRHKPSHRYAYTSTRVYTPTLTQDTRAPPYRNVCTHIFSNTRQSGLTMHSVLTHLHPQTSTVHTQTLSLRCMSAHLYCKHTLGHINAPLHRNTHVGTRFHTITCPYTCSKGSHPYALPQTHTHTHTLI